MSQLNHWGIFAFGRGDDRKFLMQCTAAGRNNLGDKAEFCSPERAECERYLLMLVLKTGRDPTNMNTP